MALLVLLSTLGFWQLDRAKQKENLLSTFLQKKEHLPVALQSLSLDTSNLRFQRIFAEGSFLSSFNILLDNQVRDGHNGYHILTPLIISDGKAILVNRGWIKQLPDRSWQANLGSTSSPVILQGYLDQPANPPLALGEVSLERWPAVVSRVEYQQIAEALGITLYPAILFLSPEEPYGFIREWQPRFSQLGPDRHRGYAVQWFGLATALLIIFIVVNVERQPSQLPVH